MAVDVYNNADVQYDSYLEPDVDPFIQQILATTAIVNINGLTGPTITFSGGTSGFAFTPGGTTITLVSPITTKGDLYTRNATTGDRLPVGADTFILTADSGATLGIKWAAPATSGTVTSVSVVSANGFAGTVATATTTPAITLTTTITGVLKGNGTAISAAASADIITALGYTPTNAAVVPNTTPTAGQILIGNAGGTAYAPLSMSGDATLASTGVLTLASIIVAGGPTGSATVAPIITYDAKGRLTVVSSATITPAVGSITGLGTGVATALGVNVGTAGAFVVNGGALGSPSSVGTLPAHTLGGTISGGGNQINNVVIGASTPLAGTFTAIVGTSITDSGLTPGRVPFATTGGLLTDDTDFQYDGTNKLTVTQFGATTVVGSMVFNTNTITPLDIRGRDNSGTDEAIVRFFKFDGTTATGSILAQSGILALRDSGNTRQIDVATTGVALPQLATDATHTDRTVCQDTTSKILFFGSGAAGICLGTSSLRYKEGVKEFVKGLTEVVTLNPIEFLYKKGYGDEGGKRQAGFAAEYEADGPMNNLVGRDVEGKPNTFDMVGLIPYLVNAVKDLAAQNELLNARLNTLMT